VETDSGFMLGVFVIFGSAFQRPWAMICRSYAYGACSMHLQSLFAIKAKIVRAIAAKRV
jgi:hypothetical protein